MIISRAWVVAGSEAGAVHPLQERFSVPTSAVTRGRNHREGQKSGSQFRVSGASYAYLRYL